MSGVSARQTRMAEAGIILEASVFISFGTWAEGTWRLGSAESINWSTKRRLSMWLGLFATWQLDSKKKCLGREPSTRELMLQENWVETA